MVTPLSCIIAFAQDCLLTINDENSHKKLKNILIAAKTLRFHLKHLLDHALIEANKLEPRI